MTGAYLQMSSLPEPGGPNGRVNHMRSLILAVALVIGTAGTASAQYYGYNYKTYNPYTGSVISGRVNYGPLGVQNTT